MTGAIAEGVSKNGVNLDSFVPSSVLGEFTVLARGRKEPALARGVLKVLGVVGVVYGEETRDTGE